MDIIRALRIVMDLAWDNALAADCEADLQEEMERQHTALDVVSDFVEKPGIQFRRNFKFALEQRVMWKTQEVIIKERVIVESTNPLTGHVELVAKYHVTTDPNIAPFFYLIESEISCP